MNTLKIEEALAEKYGYKPLPYDLNIRYNVFFYENIPEFLVVRGSGECLYTKHRVLICQGYDRIVIGDYGAFIEFTDEQANIKNFSVKAGEEYRIDDPKYSKNVKYHWYTIEDGSDVKLYKQKKKVAYADYRPGKWYVSVHEVKL